jgi:outer membrane protein assembly factor BamB
MRQDLGVVPLFMAASSPVIWEELVFVVTPNGRDSGDEKVIAPTAPSFLAVNRNTGKVVWQDNSPGVNILHGQWGSASVGIVDGVQQAVFPGGDGWLYAFNARTGEKVWTFSTAAVADGLVYVADMTDVLHCLDVKTGKPSWTYDTLSPEIWLDLQSDYELRVARQTRLKTTLAAGPSAGAQKR